MVYSGYVKGRNDYGQLGYGDSTKRGDQANEMGDFLDVVNLGTDYVVASVVTSQFSTCVVSTSENIKCFGWNNAGQLGYGDTSTRGKSSGSMGDALEVVDIGSGFTGIGMRFATSEGYPSHFCLFEESTELLLKCEYSVFALFILTRLSV